MAYETNTAKRDVGQQSKDVETTVVATGVPFWDMMFSIGKASQQLMSAYAPRTDTGARSGYGAAREASSKVEVIPIGEETLNVGTRRVSGETTRVRRVVVETPVEQDVSLREERVIVERRKPTGAGSTATQAILTDTAVEMSDSFEVVDVWKSVRVTEEVVLRREVTERHETVRDTVRRDEVVVEQAKRRMPAPKHEAHAAQHDHKEPTPPERPEPAQIAADLKKAAERSEEKAPATARAEASTHKTDHKPAPAQPARAAEHIKANTAQHEKGHSSPKA